MSESLQGSFPVPGLSLPPGTPNFMVSTLSPLNPSIHMSV